MSSRPVDTRQDVKVDLRSPRRRPSRTGRAVPTGEVGRSYLCSAWSTNVFRQCRRPVCNQHLVLLEGEMKFVFGPDAFTERAS